MKYLILFLLFPIFIFSQEKYPSIIVVNNDTLVAISMANVDSINIAYSNLDECSEMLDIQDTHIIDLDKIIIGERSIIKKQDSVIAYNNKIFILQNDKIEYQETIIKKNNRKLKFHKNTNICCGIIILLLTSLILLK